MQFPQPSGKPAFTEAWFRWFFQLLTLPEGNPVRWEGHLLLMTREFFKPELQHLTVLIPKGNFKTTWEAGLGVWHLVTVKAPRVYAGAENLEQAKELYSFAEHYVNSSGFLSSRLTVRASTREIRVGGSRSDLLKVLAGDDSKEGGKKQGKNTTLGLADEPHAYENDNLWVDLTSGGFKRREAARAAGDPLWHAIGKDCSISTAGHDPEGPLGSLRAKFLGDPKRGIPPLGSVETGLRVLPDGSTEKHPEGRLTICRSETGGSVLLEWANRADDDISDMHVVKLANPASTVTLESLADAKERLTPAQFKRYRCNIWTEGFESWLPEGAWPTLRADFVPITVHRTWEEATWTGAMDERGNALLEDEEDQLAVVPEFRAFIESLYPEGTPIVGALDMGRYRDTAALVTIGLLEGKKVPRAIVWRTGGRNKPVRYEWPKIAALLLYGTYDLRALAADPKYADQMLSELELRGVPVEEFAQSPERQGIADTDLRTGILGAEFAHDGDPILTAHVQAGSTVDVGPKLIRVVLQKVANPPPIDACKALGMANTLSPELDEAGEGGAFAWG